MRTRVSLGLIAGLPVVHGYAAAALLSFQAGWSTDFLIVCSPALALGLMALARRPTPAGRLALVLEAVYCVTSVATMALALPGSEDDEPRQIALLLIPVTGFAAVVIAGTTALLRRRTCPPVGGHGT